MTHLRTCSLLGALALTGTLFGCNNAKEGAVSGAAVGALSGLAIGSITGHAGEGAAIGAIAGLVGGAVIGDQNERRAQQQQQQASAPPPPPAQGVQYVQYPVSPLLSQMVGVWNVSVTLTGPKGNQVTVQGNSTNYADKMYFLRMDLTFTDPRTGQQVAGTSVLSQEGGNGVSMTNSFSTSPEMKRFQGQMDPSGTILNLRQVSPPGGNRSIMVRMSGPNQFTAEAWDGSVRAESLTFTRVR